MFCILINSDTYNGWDLVISQDLVQQRNDIKFCTFHWNFFLSLVVIFFLNDILIINFNNVNTWINNKMFPLWLYGVWRLQILQRKLYNQQMCHHCHCPGFHPKFSLSSSFQESLFQFQPYCTFSGKWDSYDSNKGLPFSLFNGRWFICNGKDMSSLIWYIYCF